MKMKPEVMRLPCGDDDPVAKVLYESLYGENDYGIPQRWESTGYAAPETTAGYAARLIKFAANNLRLQFLVTPIE